MPVMRNATSAGPELFRGALRRSNLRRINSPACRYPFIVAELGADVDPFMLHIYAALAQKEWALISERTKVRWRRALGEPHEPRPCLSPREWQPSVRRPTTLRAISCPCHRLGEYRRGTERAQCADATWHTSSVRNLLLLRADTVPMAPPQAALERLPAARREDGMSDRPPLLSGAFPMWVAHFPYGQPTTSLGHLSLRRQGIRGF